MKTYTAVTDSQGKVTVTFPRVFRTVPGVVATPQADVTWQVTVLSRNEFGFTARILKTKHSHGSSSGGGGSHSHVIYTSGVHWHTVGGEIHWTKEEKNVWGLASNYTGSVAPYTGGPSTYVTLVHTINSGSECESGWCVTGFLGANAAGPSHIHAVDSHEHPISYVDLWFMTDLHIDIVAWTTSQHDGHDHPEGYDGYHYHEIAEDEPTPLANTSVTFTYFAQEETT